MPGPLVGATSSMPPLPPLPPLPNPVLQSNTAAPRGELTGTDTLQLSDRTRVHLEKAAFWGAADGVPDALQSVADVKLASASSATTSWENAVKERINGAENITLSSMTEILKEIFQDAREQRCKKLLLVGSEGQILLKQKESAIKTYRLQQNGTFVERHDGVDDRLTYTVLNSLYGEEIAAQFSVRSPESKENNTVDFDHRPECSAQSETDGAAACDSIYGYKVAGTYNGYEHPENRLEINEARVAYAVSPATQIKQPSSQPVVSVLGANGLSGNSLPLMLMANSIQLEEHMPAANDRYLDPGQHDENSSVCAQKRVEAYANIENYRQRADSEMHVLQINKSQLEDCARVDKNGETKHYLGYIESCLEARKIVADAYNEFKESPEEGLDVSQARLVELIDALTPFDEVKRVVNKYFAEHRLITIPRTERPGFASSANRANAEKTDTIDPHIKTLVEELVSETVQENIAFDIKMSSRHANALISSNPLIGNDIKRNRSALARRALSSPVTSTAIASSMEPSEIIGSIEFQRMLEMFENLKNTKEPQ
jgi:hypothetical protein